MSLVDVQMQARNNGTKFSRYEVIAINSQFLTSKMKAKGDDDLVDNWWGNLLSQLTYV